MEWRATTGRVCGRRRERKRLAALTAASSSGGRGAVLLGPAGIGKTHLLDAAADDAARDGALVLAGTCLDLGDAWPLHPLHQAARDLAAAAIPGGSRLAEILEGGGLPGSSSDALAAAHRELDRLAARHRVVLALDDLQWADTSTRRLVRTLLSGLTANRVIVLGTYRPDTGADDGLLVDFHRSPEVEVLPLGPLDEATSVELARVLAPRPLSVGERARLWARSGGVPLFIRELVSDLDGDQGHAAGLHAMLEARLAALPPAARELVGLVGIGAGPVRHEVAAATLGLGESEAIAAARAAVAAGVLVAVDGGYAPAHGLFGEVAVAGLLEPERVLLHRGLAEALEAGVGGRDADPLEVAHHWTRAGAGARVLQPLIVGARRASALGATAEAWEHWRLVGDIVSDRWPGADPDPDGGRLLVEAAEGAHRAGEHETALVLLARAAERWAGPDVALVAARARYLAATGDLVAAERLQAGLADDPGVAAGPAVEAGARSAELLNRLGRHEEAVVRAAHTLDRLSRSGARDPGVELLAVAALGYSQACLGRLDAGRRLLAEALDQARSSAQPDLVEAAGRNYAELLMGPLNDVEGGVELARRTAEELVADGSDPRFTTSLLATATTGLFRLGRWGDARATATAALESDPTGAGVVDLLLGRARAVLGLGDLMAAEWDLDTAAGLVAGDPNPRQALPLATLRAGLAMWRGDGIEARRTVAEVLRRFGPAEIDDPWLLAPLVWHGLRAEAIVAGARPASMATVERLRAVMAGLGERHRTLSEGEADLLAGYHLLCEGEVGRIEGAPDPRVWHQAALIWDRCGHPYPAAYARLQEATALFHQRTRNAAAAMALRRAHATARGLEAAPLVAEIEDLARRARLDLSVPPPAPPAPLDASAAGGPGGGADPSVAMAEGGDAQDPDGVGAALGGLTARELDVIAELARGLSNREIGERLYISSRTVGVHVSNILAKLGVRTRVEAAALYARRAAGVSGPPGADD